MKSFALFLRAPVLALVALSCLLVVPSAFARGDPPDGGGAVLEVPASAPAFESALATPPIILTPDDPDGFTRAVSTAFASRNWLAALALALVAAVWLTRKFLRPFIPWLATDRGGVALVFLLSLLGTAAGALLAGVPLTFGLLEGSLVTALTAAGLYVVPRKVWGISSTPPSSPPTEPVGPSSTHGNPYVYSGS